MQERGNLNMFFTAVTVSEVSGPVLTPDNTALFVSIQHPGKGGTDEAPARNWPDGASIPRATVVLIEAENGGRIGG